MWPLEILQTAFSGQPANDRLRLVHGPMRLSQAGTLSNQISAKLMMDYFMGQ
jgi:hypothetical protein